MRFFIVIAVTLSLSAPAFAQTYDEGVEKVAIETINRFVYAIKSIRAVCDAGAEGCDKEKLAVYEADLKEAIGGAERSAADLGVDYASETDPAKAAVLAGRRDALLVALQNGNKTLGDSPKPDPLVLEKTVAAEIRRLVKTVVAMNDKCDAKEPSCNLATLAGDRFALRDLMQRAVAIDEKLLEDYKKATLDEAPKLAARHQDLLTALQPARNISFLVHEQRTAADELVDRLKALDEQAAMLEREHAKAKAAKDPKEKEIKEQAAETRTRLASLESEARAQGISDRQTIAKIDEDLKSGREVEFTKLIDQRKRLANRLGTIESMVTLPANDNPLYRIYEDDYEDWWIHQFYMGGEFDSVSGIFNKGFARLGYTSWWHTGGEQIPELRPRRGWGNFGRHYIFNALLTSTGEQNLQTLLKPTVADNPCAANAPDTSDCARRALEVEQKVFWSAYRTPRHNRIRLYAGPVVSAGATFVDPSDDDDARLAAYRYYGGMHFGFARDAWSELLFGRSSTLGTRRLEVRGEIPVVKWGAKSRVLLGWAANFRAGGEPKMIETKPAVERDVFRVYVQYELDFLALTGLQPPKP
jgi:hypothetical protein